MNYTEFNWIPLALAENPSNWPMCADFLEEKGRYGDAECLRLADSLALPMVWCPPGQFMMGASSNAEPSRFDSDPVLVTLSRGFWIGKYTVTVDDWYNGMGVERSVDSSANVLPMTDLFWSNALDLAAELTSCAQRSGVITNDWKYYLPTEAQWEYACRAGTTTKYHFDDEAGQLEDYAWMASNGQGRIHPVGCRKPNQWGLYDMYGNVYEWCLDAWVPRPPGGIDPFVSESDVAYPNGNHQRVLRGGCVYSQASSLSRIVYDPFQRSTWVGFRLVLIPTAPDAVEV